MKKIFYLLVAFFCVTLSYATPASKAKEVAEATSTVANAVSTVHDDVTGTVSTVYNDAKTLGTTLYADGKEALTELYPEVKAAVIEIAKGIGVAAEHLYVVLVKKYVVEGVVQLIPFLVGIFLIIIGWIKLEKYIKNNTKLMWPVLYPIIVAIAGIITLCNIDYNTMFMGLINPEYGAVNYILEYAKEMIK